MTCTISLNGLVRKMINEYGEQAEHRLYVDYHIKYNEDTGKFICLDENSPFLGHKTTATYSRK